MLKRKHNSALTILSVIVALGLFSVLVAMLGNMSWFGLRSAKSIEERFDLELLKKTFASRIDCKNTLRVNSTSVFPLRCEDFRSDNYGVSWSLRRKGSTNGPVLDIAPLEQFGKWQINAFCQDFHLIISVIRDGVDPLTRTPYNDQPEATDLFNGLTDTCREYFDPEWAASSVTCPRGQVLKGMDSNGALICSDMIDFSSCHWYHRSASGPVLNDHPTAAQICNWNVLSSDDCACPTGQIQRGHDELGCGPPRPYLASRCLCCPLL